MVDFNGPAMNAGSTTVASTSIVTKTYLKMGAALAVSSACAAIAVQQHYFMGLKTLLIGFLVVVVANIFIAAKLESMPSIVVYALLFGEAAFMGFMLGGTLQLYAPDVIALAFGVSVAFYAFMAIVGWTTKKNLTKLGPILGSALIVLIIVEIILLFIHAPFMWMACSAFAVVLFAGYTAYDMQKIKYIRDDGSAMSGKLSTMAALNLYLDFINLFVNILSLLGGGRRN